MAFTFQTIREQYRNLPLLTTEENCSGGTYIVTGANIGLGYEAAKHLVEAGAKKVIMAVRDTKTGEAARAKIEQATKKQGIAAVWKLDLSSYDDVRAFAKRAINELERIDALIENASIALSLPHQWDLKEGHESSVTINLLSTFLLAALLLPKMMDDAKKFKILPHIAAVTSGAGFVAKPEFDQIKEDPIAKLDDQEAPGMTNRYPLTKLLQIFVVRELAKLLPVSRTGVVINCISPGLCKTTLSRNANLSFKIQLKIFHFIMGRTAEMGSRTLLHAAVAGEESHGHYLSSCKISEDQLPPWIADEDGQQAQKRVWDDFAKELEVVEPGCLKRLL